MKKLLIVTTILCCIYVTSFAQTEKKTSKVIPLTEKEFIKKVWDYKRYPNRCVYKGKLPAVIDFYADWCGPCRRLAPIMDSLAEEYDGKVLFYKVNVDTETGLSTSFDVTTIPMVLFIPKKGNPTKKTGGVWKEYYEQVIEEKLLK